jgi:ElaB/YqjD/DUF883 family membrane-anchored ribosome-binding protein
MTRQIADLSHQAQRLGSLAADAVEDGVHAAKRAVKLVKRGVELGDRIDELAHRVRRHPLAAVSLGIGVGVVLGMTVGRIYSRQTR